MKIPAGACSAAFALALAAQLHAQFTPPATQATPAPRAVEPVPAPPAVAPTPTRPALAPAPSPVAVEPAPAPAAGEPKIARAEPVAEIDVTTRAQIFLDQQLFGPGKIDGRPGEFFTKAIKRYQRAHGIPETGVIDASMPLDTVFPVYTSYTVQEGDLNYVGDTPTKPA